MMKLRNLHHILAPLLCGSTLLLAGCDVLPRDSAKALARVRSTGELRVGVTENPPWVRFEADRVTGIEPELIETWAKELGVRVKWERGPEADLVQSLHRRQIDVLASGLDRSTPYSPEIALTRPYTEVADRYGKKKKRAMAVTQGESALLFSLDRFLLSQNKDELSARAQAEGGR